MTDDSQKIVMCLKLRKLAKIIRESSKIYRLFNPGFKAPELSEGIKYNKRRDVTRIRANGPIRL
jgi:hypothetical protein